MVPTQCLGGWGEGLACSLGSGEKLFQDPLLPPTGKRSVDCPSPQTSLKRLLSSTKRAPPGEEEDRAHAWSWSRCL